MEQNWKNELIHRQDFKFETICRTVIGYGQAFFEVLAWQSYQKGGRGIISISLNTSHADYLRINALSWKPQQSPDLPRIWEHYILANPLLEEQINHYQTSLNIYNPVSEYIVMLTNETQLFCLTSLCLWQKREIFSIMELGEIDDFAIAEWIKTFNDQHLRVEAQPIQ